MARFVVLGLPGLAALAFTRSAFEPFNTPKLLIVVWAGVLLCGLAALAATRDHRFLLPSAAVWWAQGAFAGTALLATVLSAAPARSAAGASNARAGLALYLCCGVVTLAVALVYRSRSAEEIVRALLVGAAPVVAYGAVQAAGGDPLQWRVPSGGPPIFSTLGNANFMAAWWGVVAVLAVWVFAVSDWPAAWRLLAGAVVVGGFVVSMESRSIQGPIIAVTGTSLLVGAWLTDHGRHHTIGRVWRAATTALLPLVVVLAAVLLLAVRGDAVDSAARRVDKWHAAVAMAVDRPLTGVGLDLFGDWYHLHRPLPDAAQRGIARTADAAHSVPLQLLAGGGAPLLTAHLGLVAAIGLIGLRGLRSSHGQRRLLLGALLGAWVAYQAQAAVSMDVPALAVLHATLAGAIVATAAPAAAPRLSACRHRPWSPAAALAITVVTGVVAVIATVPLRAEVAARRGVELAAADRHSEAEIAFGTALRLAPWEPGYSLALARTRAARGDPEQALQAYEVTLARQPRGVVPAFEMARAAERAGRPDTAAAAYATALALDPFSPDLLVEAARHHRRAGRTGTGQALLERAAASGGPAGRRAQRLLARQGGLR